MKFIDVAHQTQNKAVGVVVGYGRQTSRLGRAEGKPFARACKLTPTIQNKVDTLVLSTHIHTISSV